MANKVDFLSKTAYEKANAFISTWMKLKHRAHSLLQGFASLCAWCSVFNLKKHSFSTRVQVWCCTFFVIHLMPTLLWTAAAVAWPARARVSKLTPHTEARDNYYAFVLQGISWGESFISMTVVDLTLCSVQQSKKRHSVIMWALCPFHFLEPHLCFPHFLSVGVKCFLSWPSRVDVLTF